MKSGQSNPSPQCNDKTLPSKWLKCCQNTNPNTIRRKKREQGQGKPNKLKITLYQYMYKGKAGKKEHQQTQNYITAIHVQGQTQKGWKNWKAQMFSKIAKPKVSSTLEKPWWSHHHQGKACVSSYPPRIRKPLPRQRWRCRFRDAPENNKHQHLSTEESPIKRGEQPKPNHISRHPKNDNIKMLLRS